MYGSPPKRDVLSEEEDEWASRQQRTGTVGRLVSIFHLKFLPRALGKLLLGREELSRRAILCWPEVVSAFVIEHFGISCTALC